MASRLDAQFVRNYPNGLCQRTDDDGWEMDNAERNVENDFRFTSDMLNAILKKENWRACISLFSLHSFLLWSPFNTFIQSVFTWTMQGQIVSHMYFNPTLTAALIYAHEALSPSSPLSSTSLNKEAKLGEDTHSNSKVTMVESFLHY